MEARIAKPGKTLTISYYWVAYSKLDEIITEKIRRRVDRHNQISLKKQLYRQTDLIWPQKKY